jgi:hypothetical protein
VLLRSGGRHPPAHLWRAAS